MAASHWHAAVQLVQHHLWPRISSFMWMQYRENSLHINKAGSHILSVNLSYNTQHSCFVSLLGHSPVPVHLCSKDNQPLRICEDSQSFSWDYLEVQSWRFDFFLVRSKRFTTQPIVFDNFLKCNCPSYSLCSKIFKLSNQWKLQSGRSETVSVGMMGGS